MRLKRPYWMLVAALLLMLCSPSVFAQSLRITGQVLDENGDPMIGAAVMLPDGKTGTVTDINGKFVISVPKKGTILKFSSLNYSPREIAVNDSKALSVIMEPDQNNSLNEVVVIGYGTAKKQDLTGSVATVKMSDIADNPTPSIDQALQGRMAGVDIMSTNGDPGEATSIRIRGTRSINASNEPLIVVDGVIDAVQDIADINPADIENISVMKDASSTAIYGSRGANGVVLVTTKKGTTSRPSVSVKAQYGVAMLARELDIMNAEEFIRYRNDLAYFRSGHKTDYAFDIDKYSNDTNWIREITRPAPYQDYALSVSGKVSNKLNYSGSLGLNDNKGIIKETGQLKITSRLNLSYDFTDWLTVGLKLSYTYRHVDQNRANIGGDNIYSGAIYLTPLMGPDDAVNPLYENGSKVNNPVACINNMDLQKEYHTNTNVADIVLKPVKGLTIKSQNSYTLYKRHDFSFWSVDLPARKEVEGSDAYRYEGNTKTLSSENTITYKTKFRGGHSFDALLGYSASQKLSNYLSLKATGLVAKDLTWNNMAGVTSKENLTPASGETKVINQSVFARVNYSYKGKYYLTATGRFDGSSNFAENNKWGFFPSAAFKWNIKNEKWMKGIRPVTEMSLRLSAGRTGNDAIAAYQSLQAYATSTASYPFDGSQGAMMYPNRIDNPNLTWEKTDLYNAALDMSFFKNRLSVTVEGYHARTKDLLLSVQTIASTGYTKRLTNLGRTSNTGVELSIEGRIIEKSHFGWTSNFNMSHNRQMVDDIGNEEYVAIANSPGNTSFMIYGYKKGYPLNSLWGFQYAGVWHNTDEVERNKYTHDYISNTSSSSASSILGWPRYVDQNKDGILSQEDLIYMGNSDPVLYGGWLNTFHIYNLKLSFFFSYSVGGKIYNYAELMMAGSYTTNQYRYMLNAWHPVRNPKSDLPRAGTDDRMLGSDLAIHDASYLRLKDVNVSYTFDLKKKVKWMRTITLGVSAQNLFLITPYNGFDPDVSTGTDTYIARRMDKGGNPRARTVVGSIQIKF